MISKCENNTNNAILFERMHDNNKTMCKSISFNFRHERIFLPLLEPLIFCATFSIPTLIHISSQCKVRAKLSYCYSAAHLMEAYQWMLCTTVGHCVDGKFALFLALHPEFCLWYPIFYVIFVCISSFSSSPSSL